MSPTVLRYIIALILSLHGIGHVMGVFPALGLAKTETWHSRSWLLTNLLGDTATRAISVILFLAALIGFVGSALGLLGWLVPHEWWRGLAIISAVISLVAIALYWNAFVTFFPNKVGAIAVDVAVLIGLLLMNWPTEAQIGF